MQSIYLNLIKELAVKLWQVHVEIMDEEILFFQETCKEKCVLPYLMGWLCPAADLLHSSVFSNQH